jgi:8-oxo-dGTP pyrophosphatase MutT (NUDIX family)
MRRHMTVTTFISARGCTLLHWHEKNRMWLPAGGHIEPDEDPIQAAVREALEETGLPIVILPTSAPYSYKEPPQLTSPVTIMVEEIPATPSEKAHQHLDMIYFGQLDGQSDAGEASLPSTNSWRWVSAETLRNNEGLAPGGGMPSVAVAEDVRVLGLAAIDRVAGEGA